MCAVTNKDDKTKHLEDCSTSGAELAIVVHSWRCFSPPQSELWVLLHYSNTPDSAACTKWSTTTTSKFKSSSPLGCMQKLQCARCIERSTTPPRITSPASPSHMFLLLQTAWVLPPLSNVKLLHDSQPLLFHWFWIAGVACSLIQLLNTRITLRCIASNERSPCGLVSFEQCID